VATDLQLKDAQVLIDAQPVGTLAATPAQLDQAYSQLLDALASLRAVAG